MLQLGETRELNLSRVSWHLIGMPKSWTMVDLFTEGESIAHSIKRGLGKTFWCLIPMLRTPDQTLEAKLDSQIIWEVDCFMVHSKDPGLRSIWAADKWVKEILEALTQLGTTWRLDRPVTNNGLSKQRIYLQNLCIFRDSQEIWARIVPKHKDSQG